MESTKRSSQDKPKRGRPLGSSRYNEKDDKVLFNAAEAICRNPHMTITKALRDQEIDDESRLARLRRKWSKRKGELLSKANAAELAEISSSEIPLLMSSRARFRDQITQIVRQSPLQEVREHVLKVMSDLKYRERLSADLAMPIDPTDPEAIGTAIAKLEMTDPENLKRLHDRKEAGELLPNSDEIYALALLFHEIAIAAWEREKEEKLDE